MQKDIKHNYCIPKMFIVKEGDMSHWESPIVKTGIMLKKVVLRIEGLSPSRGQ